MEGDLARAFPGAQLVIRPMVSSGPRAEAAHQGGGGPSAKEIAPLAIRGCAYLGAGNVFEAARRVAAMAIVDAGLAMPRSKPLCDAALGALAFQPSNGGQFMYYRPSSRSSVLLVLSHPSGGASLCRRLADVWEEALREQGLDVVRVDLGASEQLGLSGADELRASLTGKDPDLSVPARVRELQLLVEESQFLVFVHPIFWFDVPSQLKGFQESVFSSGFAFRKLPGHWLLNRAADVVEHVPVVRSVMRRYAAYGLLRDKHVFITRTQGGPSSGMGIFGHEATSLESSLQFCGAHLQAVDKVAEIDDTSAEALQCSVLPSVRKRIVEHSRSISSIAAASGLHAAAGQKSMPPCV